MKYIELFIYHCLLFPRTHSSMLTEPNLEMQRHMCISVPSFKAYSHLQNFSFRLVKIFWMLGCIWYLLVTVFKGDKRQ